MTVNALQPSVKIVRQQKYTQKDLMIDPLIVLRCDQRVHRWASPSFSFYVPWYLHWYVVNAKHKGVSQRTLKAFSTSKDSFELIIW